MSFGPACSARRGLRYAREAGSHDAYNESLGLALRKSELCFCVASLSLRLHIDENLVAVDVALE